MNKRVHKPCLHDRRYLDAALRLARMHEGLSGTNPSVACLLVRDEGVGHFVIGSAITAAGGRPHAESLALDEAGDLAFGATAYATLEPCAHHGRTPPCAAALIEAGIARVVTASVDPDLRVNGKGHAMLRAAGIEVVEIDGGASAARLMQGYLKIRAVSKPFVTLKLAMTKSGTIGLRGEGQLPITGGISNAQVHLMRARHDAILVGVGTVLADNPLLTCRLPGLEARSPARIVLDAKAQLKGCHRVVSTAKAVSTLVVAPHDVTPDWQELMTAHGVRQFACEMQGTHIALPELLDDLAATGIQTLMVEGGASIAKSFLVDGLVDEIMLFVGGSPEPEKKTAQVVQAPFSLDALPQGFEIREEVRFGSDICLRLRRAA